MDKYLIELFSELNKKNINYVVLRGYETLPHEINHDIDLAVLENELAKMVSILIEISNKYEYKKVFESKRKDFYQLYIYNVKNGHCVKFDLWTNFTYKGLEYIKMDSILKNIKFHNNIKVLKDDVEVLLSFLKEFLHNGKIRKDKYKILKEKLNIYGFYDENSLYIGNDNIQEFSSYFEKQKFDLQYEKGQFIKKLFFKNIKYNGFIKTFNSVFDYLYKYIKDKLKKKSFFIVLIGPDGSGKTTLSKMLIDEINAKTSCFSKAYYIHGRFGILANLSRLIGKKENTNEMKFEQILKDQKIKKYSQSRISIYMIYYLFDYILGSLVLLKNRFSNTLIVADRYFYDYFYQNEFKKYPKILKFFYAIFAPKPDLLIYLKANPKDIFNRKPELTVELLIEQQKNIENIFEYKYLFKKNVIINTSNQLSITFKKIKEEITK
jgi:thymidylate kinase